MTPFVKLDCKILDKSIWREDSNVRVVWITILAMADSDGLVEAAIPGIAARANISIEETERAIKSFQEPDKWSSSQDHEGRRIERVDGGFHVLNYQQYRDKDYTAAARVKKYRECLRVTGVTKRAEYIYASEVLSYLNLKTGRKYRVFKNILPRLREGRTVEEMKKVIDVKSADPYFIENPQYMNPETLFRPGNFDRYVNQKVEDFNGRQKPSSLNIGAARPETPQVDPWVRFMGNFPEPLESLRADFENYVSTGKGADTIKEKLVDLFKDDPQLSAQLERFMESQDKAHRTEKNKELYRINFLMHRYGVPEFEGEVGNGY